MDLKKRLGNLLEKDKQTNPKYLISVIKSDIYYLLNNYFEIDFEDIDIDIDLVEGKYQIEIRCFGERIKLLKTLP